jgi:hypothetical protein
MLPPGYWLGSWNGEDTLGFQTIQDGDLGQKRPWQEDHIDHGNDWSGLTGTGETPSGLRLDTRKPEVCSV